MLRYLYCLQKCSVTGPHCDIFLAGSRCVYKVMRLKFFDRLFIQSVRVSAVMLLILVRNMNDATYLILCLYCKRTMKNILLS